MKAKEQTKVLAALLQLEEHGITLPYPLSTRIRDARHAMRELRIQIGGKPFRVLYAFDPGRDAVVILGGDKTGDERWYKRNVPIAESLFDAYLADLEVKKDGKVSQVPDGGTSS